MTENIQNNIINENKIYVNQLKELVGFFSKIENTHIRQYCINIIREIHQRSHNISDAEKYISDIMEYDIAE